MSVVRIEPGRLAGSVQAPPSKSYTHRELVASFFGGGRSELVRPLRSSDTVATCRGLERLGARVSHRGSSWFVDPPNTEASPPPRWVGIDCGESGTSLRFLTAVAATRTYPVRLSGGPRLSRRPIHGLLDFLAAAGAEIKAHSKHRALPITVRGPVHAFRGRVDASESSQYLSALLLVLPSGPGPAAGPNGGDPGVGSLCGRDTGRPRPPGNPLVGLGPNLPDRGPGDLPTTTCGDTGRRLVVRLSVGRRRRHRGNGTASPEFRSPALRPTCRSSTSWAECGPGFDAIRTVRRSPVELSAVSPPN